MLGSTLSSVLRRNQLMYPVFNFSTCSQTILYRGLSCFVVTAAIIAFPCKAQTDTLPSSEGSEQAGSLPKLRSAMPVMPCKRPAWSREAIERQMTGTVKWTHQSRHSAG